MRATIALLLALAVALPAAAAGHAGAASASPCRRQPASSQVPPLTAVQCAQAARIVARSSYLRKLLAGRHYTIGLPDPWGGNGNRDLGAIFLIHLAKRLDVARTELPVADFPSDDSSTYTPRHEAVSIHGATALRVFVDLARKTVVWVMPQPDGSEGPPPTSVRPYTMPPGFAPGTAGATQAAAAAGLLMHLVSFDRTGRLEQQEWADPLTGKAVTDLYDAERKLVASMVSVQTGSTLRVTSVDYVDRTWTSGTGPVSGASAQTLALDSRTLPALLQARITAQTLTPAGSEPFGGVDASRFLGQAGIAYWSLWFEAGTGELWLDPTTSLPLEATLTGSPTGAVELTTYFSWASRTSAGIAGTALPVPAGFKHTASSGLPHIFGD